MEPWPVDGAMQQAKTPHQCRREGARLPGEFFSARRHHSFSVMPQLQTCCGPRAPPRTNPLYPL